MILEARRDKKKVHFVTLMEICHLKKFRGRVVLRGDIVKDDSGAFAVFAEQGLILVSTDSSQSNGRCCMITRL